MLSIKKLHHSSIYLYILLFSLFYIVPLFLDYLYSFNEYRKYWGFRESSEDSATRIVYDICLIFTLLVLFIIGLKSKGYKSNVQNIRISHIWLWIGAVLAPLIIILFVRNLNMLYLFQWREIELFDISRDKAYNFAEQATYLGICSCCILLLDRKNTFKLPVVSKVLAIILLFINISIEGKRAALFFMFFVIAIILVFRYIDYIRETLLRYQKISLKMIAYMLFLMLLASTAIYFMYEFSIDVKLNRGYSDDVSIMVEAFRVDMFRDDRVRMAIFSDLYPETMRIVRYAGQTIFDSIKYVIPFNFVCGFFGFDLYIFQHYFSAALDGLNSLDEAYMTVTIYSELIANFGVFFGEFLYILLILFLSRITDRAPKPFNILIVVSFIMISLFDLSYCILLLEYSVIIFYANKKIIKNENSTFLQFKRTKKYRGTNRVPV